MQNALAFIPADDRETWLRMAFAVKSELGDAGFEIWDAWSQTAPSYKANAARDTWKSASEHGPITVGTLFHEAKANGWHDDGTHQRPTAEELAEQRRIAAERAAKEEAEIARERADTAKKAAAIWKVASVARADNPYLKRKQVAPVAALREIDAGAAAAILGYAPKSGDDALTGRLLVVPIKQGGSLSTLELIDETGRKAALAGRGTKTGGFWAAGPLPDGDDAGLVFLIGEGVATVLSAAEATGYYVVAALSCGNLEAVARVMKGRYPLARLVILADIGHGEGAARKAAEAIGGALATPVLPDGAGSDFNDLARLQGPAAVKSCIEAALAAHDSATGAAEDAGTGGEDDPGPEDGAEDGAPETADTDGPLGEERRKPLRDCYRVDDAGTWYDPPPHDDGEAGDPVWICSPLHVTAYTRDGSGEAWGRLLELGDAEGRHHTWPMPLRLLAGDGTDFRATLLDLGLRIAPGRKAREHLAQYVQVAEPEAWARCVERVGWHGSAFVLPGQVVGETTEKVVYQSQGATSHAYRQAGTLPGWRESVAALAVGNSRVVFALAVAFAAPLLELIGMEGGGIHFPGPSSGGKTSLLRATASIWGDPHLYVRRWRATANGLEGLAALHNDGLLILDELAQVDGREAGEVSYMLSNGQGKARARRDGTSKEPATWRLLFLSAGEIGLAQHMSEAGKKARAGMEVRLAEVPADTGKHGAFEELHGLKDGATFSRALTDAAAREHGTAGVAWLARLTAGRAEIAAFVIEGVRQFEAEAVPAGASGQVIRVSQRFGLVAVAGELASFYGITGWTEGESTKAAKTCFTAWLEAAGGIGDREERSLLDQVKAFFEAHGSSRFEDMSPNAPTDQRIVNRAGFVRSANGGREFLVLPEVFKEITKGHDPKVAAHVLAAKGWIAPGADGKTAQKPRLPGMGPTRCYAFTGCIWEGDK
jgi:putative DNA primase/helicase